MTSPSALRPTNTKVNVYGNFTCLPLAGVFTTTISHQGQATRTKVYITKGEADMLLSCHTAEWLQLVQFAFRVHISTTDSLLEEVNQLFQGTGCLKDTVVHLHIDQSVQLVTLQNRQMAFHLQPKVEAELMKSEAADIIEKVERPTPWV
ncbi:hypothetical protein NDU88_004959 [Pleurodeles waltl]|uniref:Uncharacterized protein n=1 Tax=Pleurodeles waltl TaxID=8319 RepID=A0AAV7LMT7_PLEWA|nr:hypothetical protein NDU88_004959 [Pleurodeles waltl]